MGRRGLTPWCTFAQLAPLSMEGRGWVYCRTRHLPSHVGVWGGKGKGRDGRGGEGTGRDVPKVLDSRPDFSINARTLLSEIFLGAFVANYSPEHHICAFIRNHLQTHVSIENTSSLHFAVTWLIHRAQTSWPTPFQRSSWRTSKSCTSR
jgi:hypothetical protein